jgi:SAM-dependent methyltransferase
MYSTDFAYAHDAGFGDLAKRSAPEIIRLLRAYGIERGHVVEIGCGSGILARRLLDAGYSVTGIDRSAAMIALARANAPRAVFRVGSLTRIKMPRCRAAIAVGEVVSYVAASLGPFFKRVSDALPAGGLFIFDFMASVEGRTFAAKSFSGRDWDMIVRADASDGGRTLTRHMTLLRHVNGRYRRSCERHRVTIRSRAQMRAALAAAGFTAAMSRSYGRYRLLRGDVAVVAKKRWKKR